MLSTTAGWGRQIPESAEYLEDLKTGMNLTTIQTAHTLDLAVLLGGRLEELSAMTSIRYRDVHVTGTDRTIQRVVPDHVVVAAHLAESVPLVVEMRGGVGGADAPFRMEIVGAEGRLELVGGSARGFQAGDIDLWHDGELVEVERPFGTLPVSARNVAGVYSGLVEDLRYGTTQTASLDQAVALSNLIDDVWSAARSGSVVKDHGRWPVGG